MHNLEQIPSGSERHSSVSIATDRPANNPDHQSALDGSFISHKSPNAIDLWVAKKLLRILNQSEISLTLWDGTNVPENAADPVATIIYRDRSALYQSLWHPELYWGDLYASGRVEVAGDLCKLLQLVYRGMRKQNISQRHQQVFNTRGRAADNIHHHYDIGNDFYRLWLDHAAMQYTCAYYPEPDMELEDAQTAKMNHVCRKLQLKPGDTVVEAGCGWGGFALHMARQHDVTVKAYNISSEQVRYAREAAKVEGLSDRVEFVMGDYRNIQGQFDVFVSVGMLEHVGPRHYPVLGQIIKNGLKPGGRGLIHTIGRDRAQAINPWIERRIFPGAYPPTLREMMDIFEAAEMSVIDVENLRLHYAKTLDAWWQRFEQNIEQVESMMDEQFARTWRLYLAGSSAAFKAGQLQLFQVLFTDRNNNDLAWSRQHLYNRHKQDRTPHQATKHA